MDNVKDDPVARRAWSEIQRHRCTRNRSVPGGLVGQSALLLFLSKPPYLDLLLDLSSQHLRVQKADEHFKRAIRAQKALATRKAQASKRGRPRLDPEQASWDAVNMPWIGKDGLFPTQQAAFECLEKDTGKTFTFVEARELIVKTGGPKHSVINPFFPFAVLRELAAEYGLTLGRERIVALAICAGITLDARTLARYFARLGKLRRTVREDSLVNILRVKVRSTEFPALFARL